MFTVASPVDIKDAKNNDCLLFFIVSKGVKMTAFSEKLPVQMLGLIQLP